MTYEELWKNRDWAALSARLPTYVRWLRNLQRRWYVLRDHTIEDLATDTLAQLWEKSETLPAEAASFRNLFVSFASYALLNDWRSLKGRKKGKAKYFSASYSEVRAEDWMTEKEEEKPTYLVDNEPEWWKETVVLRAAGETWDQIAERRCVTPTACCQRFNLHCKGMGAKARRNNRHD